MTRFLQIRAATSDSVLTGTDPTKFETSNPLRLFIIQAAIIIIVTRFLGYLLSKIKQPRVIAEVIGGILLGPTAMGRIPGFSDHIFPKPSLSYLNLVSTLGLVLFLFLVGLEVDVRVVRKCAKESTAISAAGMILPFGLGAAVSVGIYRTFIDEAKVSFGHFVLFTGVAMAITAFPVLARILTETKLLYTKVGVIVLAAGVGNDVVGWILLALTVALVNASTGLTALYTLLCAVGWALILFFLIKPAFVWLARRTHSIENGPSQVMTMVTLLLVLVSAWITDIIGVHPIFGSFLVGLIVPHEGGYAIALIEKMEDLVQVIFLPIYFALSGLNTNLGDLNSGIAWAYTIAIILIAFFSKFVGCAGAAKCFGFNWRECAAIGTLMSCKGLVELIVLNIGLSAGILDTRVFSMFVFMAVVSTLITTPLTLWIYPESHRSTLDEASTPTHPGKSTLEEEKDTDSSLGLSPKRLLVVLSSFEHLPGLMTLVQLMQPTLAAAKSNMSAQASSEDAAGLRQRKLRQASSSTGHAEKAEEAAEESEASVKGRDDEYQAPVLPSSAPFVSAAGGRTQADISIDALRLVELTDRTSAVMKVSSEDTMRADPIVNVFRTFAHLNGLPVQSSLAVIPQDEFANTVTRRCKAAGSNFIILPMTLSPAAGSHHHHHMNHDNAAGPSSPLAATLTNPLESLFGGGWSTVSEGWKGRHSLQHFNVVRRIIQTAETDVGLLIDCKKGRGGGDHGLSALSRVGGTSSQILLAFMGGPDDRAALDLVSRLCASNSSLLVQVVRMQRVSAEEAGEEQLPTIPPTIHHESSLSHVQQQTNFRSLTHMDTVYPTTQGGGGGNGQSSLEASLEDDLAIKRIQDQIVENRFGGRLTIRTISTARPLRDLIADVETDQPAIVVVGRGRRNPTQTHRDELKALIQHHHSNDAAERQLNSEITKVIGEPATALTFANCNTSTLVIAAGFNLSRRT